MYDPLFLDIFFSSFIPGLKAFKKTIFFKSYRKYSIGSKYANKLDNLEASLLLLCAIWIIVLHFDRRCEYALHIFTYYCSQFRYLQLFSLFRLLFLVFCPIRGRQFQVIVYCIFFTIFFLTNEFDVNNEFLHYA